MSSSSRSRRAKTNVNMAEDAMVLDEECMACGRDTPREQATKCARADCAAIVCGSCHSSLPFNCGKSACRPKQTSMKKSTSMQEEEFAIDTNSSSSDESVSYTAEEGIEFDKATGWDDRKQSPAMAADCHSSPEMLASSTTKQMKSFASSNPARVSLSPPSSAAQPKRQKQSDNNDLILLQPNRPRPAIDASPLLKICVVNGSRVSPNFGPIQSDNNADDQDFHLMLGSQHLANNFPGFEIYAGSGVDVAFSVDRRDGFYGTDASKRLLDKVSSLSTNADVAMILVMFTDVIRIGLNPQHVNAFLSAVKSRSNKALVLTLKGCGKNLQRIAELKQQRSEITTANNDVVGSHVNPGSSLRRSEAGERLHENVIAKKKAYCHYANENHELHPDIQSAVACGTALRLTKSVLEIFEDTWNHIYKNVKNQSLTVDDARDEWIRVATMYTTALQNNTILGYVRQSPQGTLESRAEEEAFSIDGLSVYQSSLILGAYGVEGVCPKPPGSTLAILNDHHVSGNTNARESFLTSLAYIAHGNVLTIIQSTQTRSTRDPISSSIWLSIMEETNTKVVNALNIGQATSVDTNPTGIETARDLAEQDARRLQENDKSLEALKKSIESLPVDCLNGPLFDNMSPEEKNQFSNEMREIYSHEIPEHLKIRGSYVGAQENRYF